MCCRFRWTKLQLTSIDPTKELKILRGLTSGLGLIEKYIAGDRSQTSALPIFLSKGPEDVVRDYLIAMSRTFYQGWVGRSALAETKVDLVISHPVVSKTNRLTHSTSNRSIGLAIRRLEPNLSSSQSRLSQKDVQTT